MGESERLAIHEARAANTVIRFIRYAGHLILRGLDRLSARHERLDNLSLVK